MQPDIHKPSKKEAQEAKSWPIWEKEPSSFPWEYSQEECCLILEGEASVKNEENKIFQFKAGDYVIFPKGMKCTWTIHKKIKKHYNFS